MFSGISSWPREIFTNAVIRAFRLSTTRRDVHFDFMKCKFYHDRARETGGVTTDAMCTFYFFLTNDDLQPIGAQVHDEPFYVGNGFRAGSIRNGVKIKLSCRGQFSASSIRV